MAKTNDIGSFYWHTLKYLVKPSIFIERAESQEIEEPYREGRGWAIRLPFTTKALVVGRWGKAHDESSALTRAVIGRAMKQDEVDWDKIRFGAENVQEEE